MIVFHRKAPVYVYMQFVALRSTEMAEMTITEGLAEIKTIGKRLEKKRAAVLANIARDSRLKDPLADGEGATSEGFISQERQAIMDLERRVVAIRVAIQRKNLETSCTVGENTYTIQEWLDFRREVADGRKHFLNQMNAAITGIRAKAQSQGARVTGIGNAAAVVAAGDKPVVEILLHLNERELMKDQEGLEQVLGELDGKLSLLNATTVISV